MGLSEPVRAPGEHESENILDPPNIYSSLLSFSFFKKIEQAHVTTVRTTALGKSNLCPLTFYQPEYSTYQELPTPTSKVRGTVQLFQTPGTPFFLSQSPGLVVPHFVNQRQSPRVLLQVRC